MDFAFVVHPLVRWQRRVLGVRLAHLPLALGGPAGVDGVGEIARVVLNTTRGPARCAVIGVPDVAEDLATDQHRALALQKRAAGVAMALGARAIGLGNALAVVAGRGSALASAVDTRVTTGHASTAWAAASIVGQVLEDRGTPRGPVGVLGFRGTVGHGAAALLRAQGVEVWVDARGHAARLADDLGCRPVPLEEVPRHATVLLGASTTGPVLDPCHLQEGTILVDLSLPPTLRPGPRPRGLRIVAGERLVVTGGIRRDGWGVLWLWMAQYGRGAVFACFAEPAALALTQEPPFSGGRRLSVAAMRRAGDALVGLGFRAVAR